MQTILVLTDFSEAASYAASYACVLARQLGAGNIVLYHSYQSVVSPGGTVEYTGDEKSLHDIAIEALKGLAHSLKDQVPDEIVLRYVTDTRALEEINDVAIEEGAELVVMGVTGKGRLEEMVAGSHAIRVCEASNMPVVLVPVQIPMQPVGNLVFACDLEDVAETIPRQQINNLLDTFHVPLSVVHVGKQNGETQDAKTLYAWLENYHTMYYNLDNEETATAILDFAKEIPSPLLLLVARKHGFPAGLFHSSITKQLAFHSTIPLLVLREKEVEEPVPVMPLLEI